MGVENRKDPQAWKRYNNARWRNLRKHILNKHPLCKNYETCKNFAKEVDHIEACYSNDDPKFYDENNLQPLCKSCHSRKTATEDGAFGNYQKKKKRTTSEYCIDGCKHLEERNIQNIVIIATCKKHNKKLTKKINNSKYNKCYACDK